VDERQGKDKGVESAGRVSRRGVLKTGIAAGALIGAGAWGTAASAAPLRQPGSLPYPKLAAGTDTIPQIEHVVVLMMENHSYDNYLGMLRRPGADGFRFGRDGLPTATNPYGNGQVQHAFRMPTHCQLDARPSQEWTASHNAYDNGRMDGFVSTPIDPLTTETVGGVAMGYWQAEDLPFYYSLYRQFPIADRYHCSVLGQTFPNRRYLLAATSIGQIDDTAPAPTDYPAAGTIFDQFDAHGITWKDYTASLVPTSSSLALYPQLYEKNAATKIVLDAGFLTDTAAGTLPSFSLVEPDYGTTSEENPQNIAMGEQFAASIINAVMQGPAWHKSAGRWPPRWPVPCSSPTPSATISTGWPGLRRRGLIASLLEAVSPFQLPYTVLVRHAFRNRFICILSPVVAHPAAKGLVVHVEFPGHFHSRL
jgi:phospholipase C